MRDIERKAKTLTRAARRNRTRHPTDSKQESAQIQAETPISSVDSPVRPFDDILSHLGPEARTIAMLPGIERVARLRVERWIGYTRANQALAKLEALFANEPGKLRPQNLLILGPSNNGKTMIAEKFHRAHPQRISDDGEHEIIPVRPRPHGKWC
jgi:hypothetical protein